SAAAPRRSPFSCGPLPDGSGDGTGLASRASDPSMSGGRNQPDGERSDSGLVNGSGSSSGRRAGAAADRNSATAGSDPADTGGSTATTSPARRTARTSPGEPLTQTRESASTHANCSP